MSFRLLPIALLTLASVGSAQAQTAPRTPSARELIERQLAKPPPAQTPRLSAAEAQAIRQRLIERVGQETGGANANPPSALSRTAMSSAAGQ